MRTKIIFSPQLAQFLLQQGLIIVSLKPKRNSVNESVFVFKYRDDIEQLIKE